MPHEDTGSLPTAETQEQQAGRIGAWASGNGQGQNPALHQGWVPSLLSRAPVLSQPEPSGALCQPLVFLDPVCLFSLTGLFEATDSILCPSKPSECLLPRSPTESPTLQVGGQLPEVPLTPAGLPVA